MSETITGGRVRGGIAEIHYIIDHSLAAMVTACPGDGKLYGNRHMAVMRQAMIDKTMSENLIW